MGFEKTEATIFITGASDGLGKEAARKLAAQGARLILHGRSEAKLQAAVDEILNEFPDARIDTILANFSSLAQMRAMAAELNERFERLDVLVNNAGVLPLRRQVSADGFELTFAVNYLAPFLLTNLLCPCSSAALLRTSSISVLSPTILLRLALCRWITFLDTSAGLSTPAQNCC